MAYRSGDTFANTTDFLTRLYQKFKGKLPVLRDITSGSYGRYKAGKGWDCCTGVGAPLGPGAF